jgi:hypothetical protein
MTTDNGYYNLAVHPGTINIWYTSLTPRRKKLNGMFLDDDLPDEKVLQPKQFLDNFHHGKISPIAKKKISKAIDYMVYLAPKKNNPHPYYNRSNNFTLNFITLTLSSPQIHSDNDIKSNILEPFLNTCRKKWKVSHYIWRAEKQANGSIHFHIITDRFIPWNELRNIWNLHQQRLGYITRYRDNQTAWHKEGFTYRETLEKKWNRAAQKKAWEDGVIHDWCNPNSTDVHSLRYVKNSRAYFTKYLTKQEQSQNISGRLWGCSVNLSNLKGGRTYAEGNISDELSKFSENPKVRSFSGDYFTCLYFDPALLQSGDYPLIAAVFEDYLMDHFPSYRQPGLF